MEIRFEIPDWVEYQNIYVFAGTEVLAILECEVYHKDGDHKKRYLPLKVKPSDGRCTGCGSCCSAGGIPSALLEKMKKSLDGHSLEGTDSCPFLTDDGCMLGAWIPFSCAKSVCTTYEGCTEYMRDA
jgi:hypothetical protein